MNPRQRPRTAPKKRLGLAILPQPDDVTCGPTCLQAVYSFYGDQIALDEVIAGTPVTLGGGTLAVMLGGHALSRGYRVTIYSYNLFMFDPTWFRPEVDLTAKLLRQAEAKSSEKLRHATHHYVEYLKNGGALRFADLSAGLIRRYLSRNIPILTGLSATYLYGSAREYGPSSEPDDVRGEPMGHFVVLNGYDRKKRRVHVADPWEPESRGRSRQYWVDMDRLRNAILLGIVTYDANLLVIEPKD